jgi:hypothetical protein
VDTSAEKALEKDGMNMHVGNGNEEKDNSVYTNSVSIVTCEQ